MLLCLSCEVTMTVYVRSTFSEFASKWNRDARFRAIEKMRDRELQFNEYVVELRRQEDTETRGQLERVSNLAVSSL